MRPRTLLTLALAFAACALPAVAGDIVEITSTDGKKSVTYEVKFGGGKSTGQLTALCPREKKFVYLTWELGGKRPEPVSSFWDSKTGETVRLYRFPGCPDPLPAIGGVEDLRVCPFTGDKNFKKRKVGNYD
jgi:hypothetical protein